MIGEVSEQFFVESSNSWRIVLKTNRSVLLFILGIVYLFFVDSLAVIFYFSILLWASL